MAQCRLIYSSWEKELYTSLQKYSETRNMTVEMSNLCTMEVNVE